MATIEVNLIALWQAYPSASRAEFITFVAQVSDLAEDEVCFCRDCVDPYHIDDTYEVMGGDGYRVCDDCYEAHYTRCEHCGEAYPNDDMTTTLYDTEVCRECLSRAYTWCDHCEGYYADGDDDHDHSGCDCCSPQLHFLIRNDGGEPLPQDTMVTVTLPAGVITDEGLDEIRRYVRQYAYKEGDDFGKMIDLSTLLPQIGNTWQAKDGNYTKRLSRFAYKQLQLKLDPMLISAVGNIASAHSTARELNIATTRDLNLPAEDFYHGGSCWWGSYSESRCALKTNGGFALRSFHPQYGTVTGRAWVLPLKKVDAPDDDPAHALVPTFDTMGAAAYVVFNGYGELDGYVPARLMAHMAGMTYRKIRFEASPMYVNSGGYLIAPEEIAEQYTDGELYMSLYEHSNLYDREREEALVHA